MEIKMKEHLRNILFLLAAFFILLHNSIPHQHKAKISTVLSYECQGNHDSVFGFIKMVLHQNTGSDHLEHITKTEINDLDFSNFDFDWQLVPLALHHIFTEIKLPEIKDQVPTYHEFFPKEIIVNVLTLRGPPYLA